jgi:hypothetical protein
LNDDLPLHHELKNKANIRKYYPTKMKNLQMDRFLYVFLDGRLYDGK